MSKQNSKIRSTIQNAKKGDLSATFELFYKYLSGTDVEIDKEKAKQYFELCLEALEVDSSEKEKPTNKVVISKLQLINFRQFKDLSIDFENDLTVLIGKNGTGKTSVLESLAKTFSYLNARIIKHNRNGKSLVASDVRINCYSNTEVISQLKFGSKTLYDGILARPDVGVTNPKDSKLEKYQDFSTFFRIVNDFQRKRGSNEINIPLFASYFVERSQNRSDKSFNLEKLSGIDLNNRFTAIDKTATDGTTNLEQFLEWYVALDNIINHETSQEETTPLEEEVSALKVLAKNDTHPLWNLYIEQQAKLESLKYTNTVGSQKEHIDLKKNVDNAIIHAIPEFKSMFVDKSTGRAQVKVQLKDVAVNVLHVSKGQQVILSLIADIARRLSLLNPNLHNHLNGQGIILIDEVELHLHPAWQQSLVLTLLNTFPNIQFILSTHSPQVLSTVDKRNIRYFSDQNEGQTQLSAPTFQSKGVSNNDILEQLMYTWSTPDIDEAKWENELVELIENGTPDDSPEVKELLNKIVRHFGQGHFKTRKIDRLMRLQKMKFKANERANSKEKDS
jgi:predicted ATP-binding protein involved in virulence